MRNIIGNGNAEPYITHLNTYMGQFDINTLPRICFFLAIACGETGGFRSITENMNYTSADRIRQVFGASRFQNVNMEDFIRNERALANKVYGGKYGNGSTNDDGYIYRGGGIFQLTFKENYQRFSRSSGIPIENLTNPNHDDYIRKPRGAVRSACHYAKDRRLLEEADKNTPESFIAACRKVGNCPDGDNYKKKRDYWAKCKAHIGGDGVVEHNTQSSWRNTGIAHLHAFDGLNVYLQAQQQKASVVK